MNCPALFIIDNVSQTRDWLTKIGQNKGIKTDNFNSAESFLYLVNTQQIGTIILENRLPGIDGISLQKKLNQQSSPLSLVFHSESISAPAAVEAIKQGAVDVLFKPTTENKIVNIIGRAMESSLQKAQHIDIQTRLNSLTKKENIILNKMLIGLTNQQIANCLCISLRTVEVHRANIMKKFDAQNAITLATKVANIKTTAFFF